MLKRHRTVNWIIIKKLVLASILGFVPELQTKSFVCLSAYLCDLRVYLYDI
jgi:hypothetical protein